MQQECFDSLKDVYPELKGYTTTLVDASKVPQFKFDDKKVRKVLAGLAEMIGISAEQDANELRQLKAAMDKNQLALDAYTPAVTAWAESKAILKGAKDNYNLNERMFSHELKILDATVDEASKRVGQTGLWKLSGTPCDDESRWIASMFNARNWKALTDRYDHQPHVERCGGFKFVFDSTLTPEQKAAKEHYDAVNKEKASKVDEKSKKMDEIEKALEKARADEQVKRQDHDSKKKRWEDSELDHEDSMTAFKQKNPVEFEQLKSLTKMQQMVSLATGHLVADSTLAQEVNMMVNLLIKQMDVKKVGKMAIMVASDQVSGLKEMLNSPCKYPIGLIRSLPESDLLLALKPPIDFAENENAIKEVLQYIQKTNLSISSEHKQIAHEADVCHKDACS